MAYLNISLESVLPASNYIEENWVKSEDTNFFKKQIGARLGYLALAPSSLITSIADTILGVGAGLASIATLGMHDKTFLVAWNHLDSSKKIIARPYFCLLKTLNPEAKFSSRNSFISVHGNGFITNAVRDSLQSVALDCSHSRSFFKRHIASRLTYALLAISSVVTRVADGIIAVVAVPLSFITLGKVASINNLAYRTLQFTGIVDDIFFCAVKMINPWAGTKRVLN